MNDPKDVATTIRNRFFFTAIPTKAPHVTMASFEAGHALLQFVKGYGVETRLFARDECPFKLTCWEHTRQVLTDCIAVVEALPAVAGSEPRRANALAKLRAYSRALAQ